MSCSLAIVGATGAVGECLLELLEERDFPLSSLHLLASSRSVGQKLSFRGSSLAVQNLADFDFHGVQFAFFSAGGAISAEYAPAAADAGSIVIDNTSHFRRRPEIPLIVPEVNGQSLAPLAGGRIIANPNCSTIQMLVALAPIHRAFGLAQIDVATYQAVSGAGRSAIEGLAAETERLMNGRREDSGAFVRQMAFNVLPQIGDFQENGYTTEEIKMVMETHKILEDDDITVNPTCVRVPVFYGHSEAVHIRTREAVCAEKVRELLAEAPGVGLLPEAADNYPTAAENAAGQDEVWVGRIRAHLADPFGLSLWIVSDNLRKGAALNSIQIAETLLNMHG